MADGSPVTKFDPYAARAQFPILSRQVNGKPLVYLDNAASAQKPRAVIDALTASMEGSYANVHRGLHTLSNEATEAFEAAREIVARFLNAPSAENIVWTKGDRGDQSGRQRRRLEHRTGRRDHRHRDGAPLQHRAVAPVA